MFLLKAALRTYVRRNLQPSFAKLITFFHANRAVEFAYSDEEICGAAVPLCALMGYFGLEDPITIRISTIIKLWLQSLIVLLLLKTVSNHCGVFRRWDLMLVLNQLVHHLEQTSHTAMLLDCLEMNECLCKIYHNVSKMMEKFQERLARKFQFSK